MTTIHPTTRSGNTFSPVHSLLLLDLFLRLFITTDEHIPGYRALVEDIRQAGADELVCVTVSDPYTLHGWQTAMQTDNIRFLADTDATFARAYGVDCRYDECSLGLRSQRFSMIVQNGEVVSFRIVEDAANDAEQLLEELKEIKQNENQKNARKAV